ncbi:hypothetical protein NDU88_007797 [Pleurodeles waltl]|uniref:Uncharacterized protein n=1 Tax=Pleurodeles waltl TaxID=8319 RepID=A0AAV7QLU1_PLEWA|nr:hypothetical protein NDU88_007797 [Pleurodeles waltl]
MCAASTDAQSWAPGLAKKNSAQPEKRATTGPATFNTDRGSHRSARPEKRPAVGPATPNIGRGSHRGPIRRRRGSPRRNTFSCGISRME